MATAYDTLILAEPSLIHYYEMTETSGVTAIDAVAAHNGTYNGSPFSATNLGKPGLPSGGFSVQFLGSGSTSSGVSIGTFSTGGTGETVEAWVYLTSLPAGQQTVITHSIKSSGAYSTIVQVNTDGTIRWYMATSGGTFDTATTTTLSLNTWHHITLAAPSSGTAHLYIDGVASTGIAIGTPNGIGSAYYLDVGMYDDGTFAATFKITKAAIYNSGLSGSAVLAHYNAGLAVPGGGFQPWLYGDQIQEQYG